MEIMEDIKKIQSQLNDIQCSINEIKKTQVDTTMRDNGAYLIHMINNDENRSQHHHKAMYITLLQRFNEDIILYILTNIIDLEFVSEIYNSVL